MLQIQNLSLIKLGSGQVLIEDFSFVINAGDKIALISEEGNGKSSLLKTIINPQIVDDYLIVKGTISHPGIIGYLPQFFKSDSKTVKEYFQNEQDYLVVQYFKEFGLNLALDNQPLMSLSGGEKIKLQLIKLLLLQPDTLLLDEPSNDLDLETLIWLEDFINSFKGGILFVSHDETLLEKCANGIIHLEQLIKKTKSKVTFERLSYSDYVSKREYLFNRQDAIASKQREEHKEKMDRHRQLLQKVHHAQNSISRQDPATGRLLKKKMKNVLAQGKRFEKEKENFLDIPDQEESIVAKFSDKVDVPYGRTILDLNLDKLKIDDKVLSQNLKLLVKGPSKIGIIGTNGSGKSTLLKVIKETVYSNNVGYMPQNYQDLLDLTADPVSFIDPYENKTLIRKFLGAMRFTQQEMDSTIHQLSGGQQAKLLFLKMVYDENEVLILDEPTRNFSPLSNPEIREAFKAFGGCIISVSHDRKYLNEVCDKVYRLDENGLSVVLK